MELCHLKMLDFNREPAVRALSVTEATLLGGYKSLQRYGLLDSANGSPSPCTFLGGPFEALCLWTWCIHL